MRAISYREALREAIVEAMENDESVFLMGEDVGKFGGVWGVSSGLVEMFGEKRILDTPITEAGIVGAGLGAAMSGMRPIVEIMFADFVMCAGDQIVNQVAKARFMSGGKAEVPLTLRVSTGAPGSAAAQHSQSVESWFMNIPGLKIVVPATPADAKGMLKTALAGCDPVIFLEHKMLYDEVGPVPEEKDFSVPFGQANVLREGSDVTLISLGIMVKKSLEAADILEKSGISVEVVDVRTLVPFDKDTLIKSVAKTNHAVIAHEAHERAGPGAEISAVLASEAIEYLDGPILRVAAKNVPLPYSPVLEQYVLADVKDIVEAVESLFPNRS
jgi:acetoin:2,6-dichlorophenolindophenol oxidoreductase subunit beta